MSESADQARERARVAALVATEVLDTAQEACFDSLTQMASVVCETPVALVSLVDEHRQWFKSRVGFGVVETPREFSFCAHAIEQPRETMVVEDATRDERFADNPLVVGKPGIRFYAGVPLVTGDGHALGTLCVIDHKPRELTRRQLDQLSRLADHARAQLELRRAVHEMSMMTSKLRGQAKDLRAANEALQAFAYSASHDLRAPLRRVAQLAEVVRREDEEQLSEEAKINLTRIQTESRELAELVDGLLRLGRATTGELRVVPLDLAMIAREIGGRLRAQNPGREVDFRVEGDLAADGDPVLLRVALTNLLSNAWKYTSRVERPRVVVHAERASDGTLIVSVADNGVGFDPQAGRGRLFKPFQRLHDGEEYQGTGVGLATVRRVVERHGGRVWAESAPGKGATFFFTLPCPLKAEDADLGPPAGPLGPGGDERA